MRSTSYKKRYNIAQVGLAKDGIFYISRNRSIYRVRVFARVEQVQGITPQLTPLVSLSTIQNKTVQFFNFQVQFFCSIWKNVYKTFKQPVLYFLICFDKLPKNYLEIHLNIYPKILEFFFCFAKVLAKNGAGALAQILC